MKHITLALAVLAVAGVTAQDGRHPDPPTRAKAVQKATIVVDNGFKPSTVTVKAGQPVQLTFDVKNRSCATSVIFKTLNMKRALVEGKKAVLTFTVKKPGTYEFACPMNMYKGRVIAK